MAQDGAPRTAAEGDAVQPSARSSIRPDARVASASGRLLG